MSEVTAGTVPGGEGTAATAPESTSPAADQSQVSDVTGAAQSASDDSGLAPGAAVDAAQAAEITSPAPSEFVFGGRRFASQKQAEDYFRSQTGRVPEMQRKTAEQDRQIAELSSTVQALQRALSVGPQAAGHEPGSARGVQTPAGPKPFVERFRDEELPFLMSLLQDPRTGEVRPNGTEEFTYSLAEIMGNEMQSLEQRIVEKHLQPLVRQGQFREYETRALGAARNLGHEFPEFDAQNQAPEAIEAQQEFVSTLKEFPPEFVAANPELAMLATALVTRYHHGTPIFAQEPGTSGSPSARAAAAAEAGMETPGPIDGSSARPRPAAPQPRTNEEQFEADIISADDQFARNLEGKPLGWRRSRSIGA